MLFSATPRFEKRGKSDITLLPFWKKGNHAKAAALFEEMDPAIRHPLDTGDFTGKEGEMLLCYLHGNKEDRFLLVGLGDEVKISVESLRKIYGEIARFCQKKGFAKVNLVVPTLSKIHNLEASDTLQGICEGILLANYFYHLKSKSDEKFSLIKKVDLIGVQAKFLEEIEKFEKISDAVYFARDLINGNADIVTPEFLAKSAKAMAQKNSNLNVTLFDKNRIEKEGMGLLLAVGKGATHSPYFIIISYKGNPKSKDHTVFVGKGVTFDTGGLNLKPTGSMETMRDDMSGAATVLGIMAALASLKLKVNVTGVIPTCENAIDANSFKPGDVYKALSGKSVEITNTDAEGRLILADALTYTVDNLAPSRIINFATLTGAMVVALGENICGFFSNDDALADSLLDSSENTGELLWRMPLYEGYKEDMKSDIADLRNSGTSRWGGAIKGAVFLQEFVGDKPWAHLDIAGPAFASKEKGYLPKNGIGFGIRLSLDLLEDLSKSS